MVTWSHECVATNYYYISIWCRSADGSCNNLREPRYGMADTSLNRIVEPEYGNGVDTPRRSR